jgi:hypothetical protein
LGLEKEFIAKMSSEESNKLGILRHLSTPTHGMTRSMLSVHRLIPQMGDLLQLVTVNGHVEAAPEELESKVVQVCLGLIEGRHVSSQVPYRSQGH